MRPFLALILALMLWPTDAKAQARRALFVGIDNYLYARSEKYPDAAFKNLRGAVGDMRRFKEAVRKMYEMDLDTPVQGCNSANAVSVTLHDTCATRAAILDALDKLIDQSAPRDTLLFYFAGHGSQYRDDTLFDQSSGYNGTILPTDARDPAANTAGDIFDRELKARKDRATAKGVYFVSIFDSCNSGSATRDGADWQSRNVPPLEGKPPARPEPPPPMGPGDGYWVHLAAALDGEQAKEVRKAGEVGKYEGVFTNALIETINVMPYNSFGDIIREVQTKIAARLRPSQTPVAEGSLSASFGSDGRRSVVFGAKMTGAQWVLDAGHTSGMTEGSTFALFASETEALKPSAVPLATAQIVSVEDSFATLGFVTAPVGQALARMVAIETAHAFGGLQLGVANLVQPPAERKIVQAALDGTEFIKKKGAVLAQIASDPVRPGEAQLLASDGVVIGALGAVNAPAFSEKLRDKLKKILRVQQLLALRTDPKTANLRFCIDDSEYPASADACPAKEKRGGIRVLKRGEKSFVTIQNEGDKPRFIYVFGIDPNYGVALILPAPGGNDSKIAPLRAHRTPDDPVVPTKTGVHLFVTLASDEQINAAAFEQDGTNARGAACSSALERLLCDVNKGRTSAGAAKVGNWTAIVETVYVE